MSIVAYIVATVIFLLAAFGVNIGDTTELDLIAWGLAFFAVAHILPGDGWPRNR